MCSAASPSMHLYDLSAGRILCDAHIIKAYAEQIVWDKGNSNRHTGVINRCSHFIHLLMSVSDGEKAFLLCKRRSPCIKKTWVIGAHAHDYRLKMPISYFLIYHWGHTISTKTSSYYKVKKQDRQKVTCNLVKKDLEKLWSNKWQGKTTFYAERRTLLRP